MFSVKYIPVAITAQSECSLNNI